METQIQAHEQIALNGYAEAAEKVLKLSFPHVEISAIHDLVCKSVDAHFKNPKAVMRNNYLNKEEEVTLIEIANYIIANEPIITPSGVLFRKHGEVPNPLVRMVESFLDKREIDKREMFKYPKGTAQYAKYFLAQLLDKLDANATYGSIGAKTCIYYNVYVSTSVTRQGYSAVSAASLLFESFLANNVGFSSLNDMVTFISNVVDEKPNRHWNDTQVLARPEISVGACFRKLIMSSNFEWIPTQSEMCIVWNMLQNLSGEDITRLYYKNNLYEFIENPFVMNKIKAMLVKLHLPYVNPNKPPKEIQDDLAEFWDLLKEYVYYDKQLVDRLGKMNAIIRDVSIIMDTDLAIISLDAWYRCILDHTYDLDMDIKHHIFSPFVEYEYDEFGDRTDLLCPIQDITPPLSYDFYTDEVIEMEASVNHDEIVPQDGLRYSIINILAYCITQMINDYMRKYTEHSNAIHPQKGCFFIMKNEFLFKRVLDTMGKKNYATIQEIQEGNMVPKKEQLDVKGLPLDKVGMPPAIQAKLKKLLYDEVLNSPAIDQLRVLKKLAVIEKSIYQSMANGNKEYYKPAIIKSQSSYDNPMRIQGIKASIVYNALRDKEMEAIDLTKRNSIDIVKISITPKNVATIADTFPAVYEKMINLLQTKEFSSEIDCIAIPLSVDIPKWIVPFIDYGTVINDNIRAFPLQAIGLSQIPNGKSNYTNILSI